jgi:hypothetical protein
MSDSSHRIQASLSLEDYKSRCKHAIRSASAYVGTEEIEWAIHLLDRGEGPEALLHLAWSLHHSSADVPQHVILEIQNLGWIDDEWPIEFRATS